MPNVKTASNTGESNKSLDAITAELLSKLMEAEKAVENGDEWLTEEQVKSNLGVQCDGERED